jgi:hypothetical protein
LDLRRLLPRQPRSQSGPFDGSSSRIANLVSVTVTHQQGVYMLDGTDDRCGGASQPGSIVGIAYLAPGGLVGLGLTSVLPGGTAVHTEAIINIASLNGTWRDSAGNSGSFVFTPGAGVPGSPRPIPLGGIAPASITNIHIANNAVTGANIVDASITTADIVDGARSNFASRPGSVSLPPFTSPPAVLVSVTINAPTPGKVIVNASGFFEFNSSGSDQAACEITTSATTIDGNFAFRAAEDFSGAGTRMEYVPFSGTRGFNVPAGPTTFNLLCQRNASGNVGGENAQLTAIYTAQ